MQIRKAQIALILWGISFCLTGCTKDPKMAGNDPAQPRVEVEVASRISAEVTIASSASEPGITFGAEIVRIVDGEESADKISFETGELDENQTCSWWTESLQPSNTYIARTFITNGRNRKYSERKTFTTPSTSKPTVSAVTLDGENLVASVRDNGGRSIEDVGFVAGDTPDRKSLMRAEKIPAIEEENGRFSLPLSILAGGKTYYIIAYAIDDNEDVGYGAKPLEVSIAAPSQPEEERHERYLTFISEGTTKISFSNADGRDLKFYYSYNAENWVLWDYTEVVFTSQFPIYLCGDNPDGINKEIKRNCFTTSGDNFSVYGDIMSLISSQSELSSIPTPYCFASLFQDCTNLQRAPDLPATTLSESCYRYMFDGCTGLISPPQLPAKTLVKYCYYGMFLGCENLLEAPELPSETMEEGCYSSMFTGCQKLTIAPSLPASKLASTCYSGMFAHCTNLYTAPELPAVSMAPFCYHSMFRGCEKLSKAPALPATVLAEDCYCHMFDQCTSLYTPPELPATTLAPFCYCAMFWLCENLKETPELPATTLAESCYGLMFEGCAKLTVAHVLPASSLVKDCYKRMFNGCHGLREIKCLAINISAEGCTTVWLGGVSETGTFAKAEGMEDWPTGVDGIPEGWTVVSE